MSVINKQYLLVPGKILLEEIVAAIMSLLFVGSLQAAIEHLGLVWYSVFVCLIYLVILYDDIWKEGKKDARSYSVHKPYPLKGLVYGLISMIIPAAILFSAVIFDAPVCRSIYMLIMFPFIGFLGTSPDNSVTWHFYLSLLYIPALSTLAYYSGVKNKQRLNALFRFMIYKKKDQENKK